MDSKDEEKKDLLESEEPSEYGASVNTKESQPRGGGFIYKNREKIPGYNVYRMVRTVKPYALYVLLMMLVVYLLNQLDRYTLPVTTTNVGYDLRYGNQMCMTNHSLNATLLNAIGNMTDFCTADNKTSFFDDEDVKNNETLCDELYYEWNGTEFNICEWGYDGSGILYQVVAGPVFNNLYILAGIFAGFLADYGRRTVWLVLSLVFWSVATGCTGFVAAYWELVVLRALLAIGAAGCSPFAVSILADYFPPEFRGTSVGFYYWGIYIGYSLSFLIGNSIQDTLGWRWVFFISGLIGIAVAPIVLFTVKEPPRTSNLAVDNKPETQQKLTVGRRIILLLKTFFMPGMFMLCLAGGIRNAGGYVWAYNTELFFLNSGYTTTTIQSFMSWIPLVAGSIGAVVGGLISDILVKGRSPYMRIWVLIISQLAAAPFALGALFLSSPWCFLSLIPSNVIGEMWIGVTTAIVIDLAPSRVRTGAISIYLFIITLIGGNFNLIISPIVQALEKDLDYLLSYRITLSITFPGVYVLSSLLFILTFFLMRGDLRRKKRLEEEEKAALKPGRAPMNIE